MRNFPSHGSADSTGGLWNSGTVTQAAKAAQVPLWPVFVGYSAIRHCKFVEKQLVLNVGYEIKYVRS